MNIDEAKSAIRAANVGFAVPSFLATEAVIAVCDIVFDKKSSARDMLRAVETLLAIERLNIDLAAAKPANTQHVTVRIIEPPLEYWHHLRDEGANPLPPAPPPPTSNGAG